MHGKGKLIDYFQKTTKQGKFVRGGFKKWNALSFLYYL
jgi:hypothetical protein